MTLLASEQCPVDPRCEYASGHYGECTTVEVGKHVRSMRASRHANAYRHRLQALLARVEAEWMDELVEASTPEHHSPLLIVGWVSARPNSSGYGRTTLAETWHRDRHCTRNRAMGSLAPFLYLEVVGSTKLRPCAGCGLLTEAEKAQARVDTHTLRERQLAATEGICWGGRHSSCGRDVVPGTTTCAEPKHIASLTPACHSGHHTECDSILETKTRPHDGSTYTIACGCWVCH